MQNEGKKLVHSMGRHAAKRRKKWRNKERKNTTKQITNDRN